MVCAVALMGFSGREVYLMVAMPSDSYQWMTIRPGKARR